MTLLLASLGEEMAVLAADSAISTVIDGAAYRVQDDYKKSFISLTERSFFSPVTLICPNGLSVSTSARMKKGAAVLQRIMREEYAKYSSIRPQIAELKDYVGLFGFICQVESGKIAGYLINSANKFEIERCEAPASNSVTVTAGVNEKIAQSMLTESYAAGVGALQAYAHIFDTLASEKIGGKADVYLMDRAGIRKIHTHTIKEPQLKRVDRRFVRSAAVLDKQIQALMLDAVITGSHINVGGGTFTVDGTTGHMRTTSGGVQRGDYGVVYYRRQYNRRYEYKRYTGRANR
ncbi:hypothetical protein ACFSQ7_48650 [Paenibacillus rhizoplanae]|uniref:hypothetical protein n=1 Tax=Paenibacillus rhizoplanae TaxID=1917181 RepID=UPI00361739BF